MALKSSPKLSASKIFLTMYKVALGAYGVLLMANLAMVGISNAQLGFGDLHMMEQQKEQGAAATVADQLCFIYGSAGVLVGVLTALFIIWGGIAYALSMGNDKGDLSVGSAKSMIVSALTGMFLYMMGYVLLGVCTAAGGGIIPNLLK